jgi:hypothetical protein
MGRTNSTFIPPLPIRTSGGRTMSIAACTVDQFFFYLLSFSGQVTGQNMIPLVLDVTCHLVFRNDTFKCVKRSHAYIINSLLHALAREERGKKVTSRY